VLVTRTEAPAAAASATQPPAAALQPKRDGGDAALFGPLVALGQGLALGEALGKNAENAERYLDRLCDENRKLHDHPVALREPGNEHDAAEFLAPLIDYEKPLDEPHGRLHLAAELSERLASYGPDWPGRITDRDLAGLDFSWLPALAPFDHWSLLGAGRLRDVPPGNSFADPIPSYVSLRQWSQLRYALARRRGDLVQASAEVHHLADLTRSQGILIAEMTAVAMLRLDEHAMQMAGAAGYDVSGWTPPDVEQFGLYRRMEFASVYFTYPGVSAETVRKAVGCMPSPCSALLEGAAANRSFGKYGTTDNLALLGELFTARGCEAPSLARVLRSRELLAPEVLSEGLPEDLEGRIPKFFAP
jgi:hypothetical protein